jgi:dipeptidyl aminopeptidase/acylaminoacyl peptidase
MRAARLHLGSVAALVTAAGIFAACGDSTGTDPDPDPQTGAITVTTATTGTDPDDGYSVVIDGTARGTIGPTASVTVSNIAPGSHTVELQGINENCTATGDTSVTVAVTAGETATAAFAITCQANVGTLVVTVLTTGVELDADGYGLAVEGGTPTAVSVNDTVTLAAPAGAVTITLSDLAVTCDPSTGERSATGTATTTATVPLGGTTNVAFDIACTSKDIVYVQVDGDGVQPQQIFRMNTDGSGRVQLTSGTGEFFSNPAWSPDGSQITYSMSTGATADIYVMNADGSDATKVCCTNGAENQSPTWSPDGSMIAWAVYAPPIAACPSCGIWSMNADGTGQVQLTSSFDGDPDWGPDGRIAFARLSNPPDPTLRDLYIMDGDGGNVTLLRQDGEQLSPAWSPDGATIAYHRVSGEQYKIWTIPSVGGTPTQRVGEQEEFDPAWSPDGTQLVFWYWDGPRGSVGNAHGLCVAPSTGGTCTRLSSSTTRADTHIDPDWR